MKFIYLIILVSILSLTFISASEYGYDSSKQTSSGGFTTQTIVINGSATGTCPSGYAVQNLTGVGLQCVLMPTGNSSWNESYANGKYYGITNPSNFINGSYYNTSQVDNNLSKYAKYNYTNNNFNGSGNFVTTGNITAYSFQFGSSPYIIKQDAQANLFITDAGASTTGSNAILLGQGVQAGDGSVVIGDLAQAQDSNIVIGASSQALNSYGTVIGTMSYEAGNSVVIGSQNYIGQNSIAIGNTIYTGDNRINIGNYIDIDTATGQGYFYLNNLTNFGNIIATQSVTSSNIGYNDATHSTWLGTNTGTGGTYNTWVGQFAGGRNSGTENLGFGYASLYGAAGSTGSYNIGLGLETGFGTTTGSSNIFLGNFAGYSQTTRSKTLLIGTMQDINPPTITSTQELTNTLIYGTFDYTNPSAQNITFNAGNVFIPYANLTIQNKTGITKSFNMTNGSANTCWMNFTGGVLTSSTC